MWKYAEKRPAIRKNCVNVKRFMFSLSYRKKHTHRDKRKGLRGRGRNIRNLKSKIARMCSIRTQVLDLASDTVNKWFLTGWWDPSRTFNKCADKSAGLGLDDQQERKSKSMLIPTKFPLTCFFGQTV